MFVIRFVKMRGKMGSTLTYQQAMLKVTRNDIVKLNEIMHS